MMTKSMSPLFQEPRLSPGRRALSTELDEALSTRTLLKGNNSGNLLPLFSTNHDYIRLEDLPSESHLELQNRYYRPAKTEDFEPQPVEKMDANFWTKPKQFWNGLLPGWRKSLALNSMYITIVFLVNILWLAMTASNYESEQGIYTLYEGSCSRASTTNSLLHVLINILSTALLASSNYAAQYLLSPTRTEVERAHRDKKWLYIGIPNMKNLLWISWRRKLLVGLLIISAWPLHVLWNSVVFKTIQANQYAVLVVSTDFISSENFDDKLKNVYITSEFESDSVSETTPTSFLNLAESLYNKAKDPNSMEHLENAECMKTYMQPIISNRRNLLLVTNTTQHPLPSNQSPGNGSILAYLDSEYWLTNFASRVYWNPGEFACSDVSGSQQCTLVNALKHADNWMVESYAEFNLYGIDYCLSETVPEVCQVQLILPLLTLVIICNLVKIICVVSTVFTFKEPPLVVIGDALASFLDQKDSSPPSMFQQPKGATEIKRWKYASRSDLVATISLSSIALVIAGILLGIGIKDMSSSSQSFGSIGLGQATPNELITWMNTVTDTTSASLGTLILVIIVVNLPQIVFTLLYLIYNRTYTKMLAMHEWTKFAIKRRGLRVSQPSGIQRSTYWLHLPYRYSIALLIASSFMHWILSESIFLVRVAFYDKNGVKLPQSVQPGGTTNSNIVTLPGYSIKAIIVSIALGGTMLLVLFVLSFRKFKSAMPLVGNNSWAISTACQRPDDDGQAALRAVKWGAVSHPEGDKPGHCCLTSFEVEEPIQDGWYT